MATSNIARLPPELYRPIIEHLRIQGDVGLHSLLFVSRAFHGEVERALYHTLNIHYGDDDQAHGAHAIISITLQRLLLSPRVASFVQALIVTGRAPASDPSCTLLRSVLRALLNLRVLSILLPAFLHVDDSSTPRCFVVECARACLKSITVDSFSALTAEGLDSQPNVEAIYTIDDYDYAQELIGLSGDALPKLSILSGASDNLQIFLSDRKESVTRLEWTSGVPTLPLAVASVQSLVVHIHDGSSNILRSILTPFPNVQYLHCIVHTRRSLIVTDPVKGLDATLGLDHLSQIYLEYDCQTAPDVSVTFKELFQLLPGLQVVAMQTESDADTCFEWVRIQDEIISSQEISSLSAEEAGIRELGNDVLLSGPRMAASRSEYWKDDRWADIPSRATKIQS